MQPEPLQGGINGVVWRDFKPGGGTPGEVETEELGLPGVTVELVDSSGDTVDSATTEANGTFAFEDVEAGNYRVGIGEKTFAQPFEGVSWLGEKLITPSIMIAYIWIWAGFAMVVIAAGLAAIPRDTLEAARTDGATEWQVFRRDDRAAARARAERRLHHDADQRPQGVRHRVRACARVGAGRRERDRPRDVAHAFGGSIDFGLGAAIAVLLFVLVIPILALNIRRFRREA